MASPTKAKPAGQKPVTAHPLFPAIVALWFAALIGIGSLVLPQALYDQAGAMMGLGTLGVSARIGVALIAGFAGGALGMFVARKASATHTAGQPAQTRQAPPPKSSIRPISAMEELGSDRLDEPLADRQPGPVTGRRRSLSLNDESGPSEHLAQVPLPGEHDMFDLIGAQPFADDSALELCTLAEPDADEPVEFEQAKVAMAPRQVFQPAYGVPATQLSASADEPPHSFAHADADWTTPDQQAGTPPQFGAEPTAFVPRPFSRSLSAPIKPAQLASFDAPPAAVVTSDEQLTAADSLAAAARPVMAPFTMPAPVEHPVKADALAGTALQSMALADLIDRFAEALRRADPASLTSALPAALRLHVPKAGSAPQTSVAPPAIETGEAAQATPVFAGYQMRTEPRDLVDDAPAVGTFAMPHLPTALMPIGYDEIEDGDEDDDDAFGHRFEFPLTAPSSVIEPQPAEDLAVKFGTAPFGLPQIADSMPDRAEENALPIEDDHPDTDDTFGSLLAMKSGFGPGREFVRIEDEPDQVAGIEPVVVFPGMASPGRAAPAADGPSREAIADVPETPAPFAQGGVARLPFGVPQQTAPADAAQVDRSATEQALRDALAKLQQMSGAA